MEKEKAEWLKSIGAKEFPEPIKYIYTFPGYGGAFNLSERYVEDTDLEDLKAQYERNKVHAEIVIRAKEEADTSEKKDPRWIVTKVPEDCKYIFACTDPDSFDRNLKTGMIAIADGRDFTDGDPMRCFLGYMPNADPRHLDSMAGILTEKQEGKDPEGGEKEMEKPKQNVAAEKRSEYLAKLEEEFSKLHEMIMDELDACDVDAGKVDTLIRAQNSLYTHVLKETRALAGDSVYLV